MADENNEATNHRLLIPDYDAQDQSTIYKLTLSMKRRFSPFGDTQTPSPQEAREVRDLLARLVEIDNESRELLRKVFSLLEKDEKLEMYVKKRIEDPTVSKMWLLIEQLLDCQYYINNIDELLKGDNHDLGNYETYEKSIKDEGEGVEEMRNDKFKVRNLLNGTESEADISSTNAAGSK